MAKAKSGDSVKVHYTGKLTDGAIFDSSKKESPLEFTIGDGKIIRGFEQAVIGLEPGESVTVNIKPEEGYGVLRKELILEVDKAQIPTDVKPEVGRQLEVRPKDGAPIIVTITGITDTHVTLDANHPLAGKELVFDIELAEIV